MTGRERSKKKSVRNNPVRNEVGGEGGAPGDPAVYDGAGYFPAAHGVDHTGADIHPAAHEGPHTGVVRYFKKALQPKESTCWSTAKM